jgi:two-component system cell cycle sensor histidine kinase/response regulator CckA
MTAKRPPGRPKRAALLVALAYVVVAGLYIWLSDRLVSVVVRGDVARLSGLQTLKGWGFVAVTAVALYVLVSRRAVAVWRSAEAEASRQLQEAHRQALFEHGPDAAMVLEGMRFTAANRAAGTLFRCAPDELVGRAPWEISPALQPGGRRSDELAAERLAAVREGEVERFAWRHRRDDGAEFDAEISLTGLPGSPPRTLAWVRDVSAEIGARDQLADANERLRLLVEGTRHFFFYLQDRDAKIVYVSPTVRAITGREPEQWIGRCDWFPTGNPINVAAREATREHLAGRFDGKPVIVEVSHIESRPVLLEVYEYGWYREGQLVGLQGIAHDVTERVRAEEAVRVSEARYRTLAEAAHDSIFILAAGGEIRYLNAFAASQLGETPERLIGRRVEDALPSGFAAALGRMVDAVFASGDPAGEELLLDRGGTKAWLDTWLVPIRGPGGGIEAALGIARDVTERQRGAQVQAALYEIATATATHSLDDLFPAIHTIVGELMPARNFYIALHDPSTDLLSFPYEVDEYDEPSPPHPLGRGLTEYVLRTGQPLLASPEVFDDLVGRGDVEPVGAPSIDWLGVPLKGQERCIGVLAVQTYTEGVRYGEEDLVILTFVSSQVAMAIERKRAEEALRDSEERYRALVELSPDGIAVHVGGLLVFANTRGARLLGYASAEEVLGRPILDFVHPDSRPFAAERAARAQSEGEGQPPRPEKFLRRDGSVVDVEVASIPFSYQGRPAVQVVFRDIGERIRMEEHLRQRQRLEAIGRLAGGVAHDFNNILQALLGTAQVLRSAGGDGERVRALAGELETHIRRGASLTRQLLLFSRQEVTRSERLDLNSLVAEVGELLRRLAPETVRIEIEAAPDSPCVEADRGQLEQVLVNLVVNAVDAMPDGGPLTVRTGKDGGWAWFEVEDTGHGMSHELQERIFEPFFTTKAIGKGTGLGLAVVHGIVSRHQGRVDVHSVEGTGSTFRVSFPAQAPGSVATPAAAGPPAAPERSAGDRILLVEDEPAARHSLEEMLALMGYDVLAASSAEEALARAAEEDFDILLTDLLLPGLSGARLQDILCAARPSLRVVVMSGYAEDEAIRQGLRDRRVGFLQKPFDMATLARELQASAPAGEDSES